MGRTRTCLPSFGLLVQCHTLCAAAVKVGAYPFLVNANVELRRV